jgi:hypothetical protein
MAGVATLEAFVAPLVRGATRRSATNSTIKNFSGDKARFLCIILLHPRTDPGWHGKTNKHL